MKNLFATVSFAVIISVHLISCGPSEDEANKYYNEISGQITLIFEKEAAVFDTAGINNPGKLDLLFDEFATQVDSSEAAIIKMEAFDGNAELKDAALNIIKTYKESLKSDYKKLLEIWKIPDSLYSAEEDDEKMEIGSKIDDKLNKNVSDFAGVQKSFINKYKIENVDINNE